MFFSRLFLLVLLSLSLLACGGGSSGSAQEGVSGNDVTDDVVPLGDVHNISPITSGDFWVYKVVEDKDPYFDSYDDIFSYPVVVEIGSRLNTSEIFNIEISEYHPEGNNLSSQVQGNDGVGLGNYSPPFGVADSVTSEPWSYDVFFDLNVGEEKYYESSAFDMLEDQDNDSFTDKITFGTKIGRFDDEITEPLFGKDYLAHKSSVEVNATINYSLGGSSRLPVIKKDFWRVPNIGVVRQFSAEQERSLDYSLIGYSVGGSGAGMQKITEITAGLSSKYDNPIVISAAMGEAGFLVLYSRASESSSSYEPFAAFLSFDGAVKANTSLVEFFPEGHRPVSVAWVDGRYVVLSDFAHQLELSAEGVVLNSNGSMPLSFLDGSGYRRSLDGAVYVASNGSHAAILSKDQWGLKFALYDPDRAEVGEFTELYSIPHEVTVFDVSLSIVDDLFVVLWSLHDSSGGVVSRDLHAASIAVNDFDSYSINKSLLLVNNDKAISQPSVEKVNGDLALFWMSGDIAVQWSMALARSGDLLLANGNPVSKNVDFFIENSAFKPPVATGKMKAFDLDGQRYFLIWPASNVILSATYID